MIAVNPDFDMDLSGLSYDWDSTGAKADTCAGCGKLIDPDDAECGTGVYDVPLILFRGKGKKTACLYFHSVCGAARVRVKERSLAE